MLEIKNLNFGYSNQNIIENLTFEVQAGEIVALKGVSGAGKSTILRLISGLEEPKSGSIILDRIDITNVPTYSRDIGYVFQDFALFPHLKIADNLKFGISNLSKKVQTKKVLRYAKLFEIEELLKRYPHQISGGQKQRVAIVRSIITEPKVLLLDEPMSALDEDLKVNIRKFLRTILKELKITTIVVTHDKNDAKMICDREIEI